MGAETTVNLAFILSVISCVGVIYNIVHTSRKDNRNDTNSQMEEKLNIERNFVKINVKLDDFCETTKTILKNQDKSNDEIKELSQQIVKSNERIENLFERVKRLEDQNK